MAETATPGARCDCESGICEERRPVGLVPGFAFVKPHGHFAGDCENSGAHRVMAFGRIQRLCDHCLDVACKNFPNDVEVLA